MSSDNFLQHVTQARLLLQQNGYEPIPTSGKSPVVDGWASGEITPKRVREETIRTYEYGRDTGLRTGRIVGIDVDLYEPEHIEAIIGLVTAALGQTPLVRYGRKACMLCYHNRAPIEKLNIKSKKEPGREVLGVEVLGLGQQFIAFGLHETTGHPYEWHDQSPANTRLAELPEVTPEQLRRLRPVLHAKLVEFGYNMRGLDEKPETRSTESPREAPRGDARADEDEGKIAAAVAAIPNDFDRDEWVKIGEAIAAATGKSGFGYSLWEDFCGRWTGGTNSSDQILSEWKSFKPHSVTASTLYWYAHDADPNWQDMVEPAYTPRGARMSVEEMLAEWESTPDEERDDMLKSEQDYPEQDEEGETADAGYTGRASTGNRLTPIHSAADLPDRIPPRQWLLDLYWCRGFVSSTSSGGGSGKSSLMLARCIEMVTGRQNVTGEHVFQIVPTLYCCFEDDKDEVDRRIQSLCELHEIQPATLADFHYHIIRSGDVLAEYEEGKNGKMREGGLVERLRNTIIENRYGVVVLDPFVNTHNLPENDNNAMNYVKRVLVRLASELNIAVDIPHHTPKGSRAAGDADNWRGGSALKDGLRLCYTLTTMTEAEAIHYGIDPAERYRYIHSDSAKINIAPGGQTRWFQLVSVNLGNGDDLYPNGDNVGAIAPWTPPEPIETVLADDLEAKREILRKIAEHDPPYSLSHRVGKKLTHIKHAFQDHFPGISMPRIEKILGEWVEAKLIEYASLPSPNHPERSGKTYNAVVRLPEQDWVDRMSA